MLLGAGSPALEAAQSHADAGMRVLVVGKAGGLQPAGTVPTDFVAAALVVCADEIRPDAADTIAYFQAEHVVTKVISGRQPAHRVAAIAARCGIPSSDQWIDAREHGQRRAGLRRGGRTASPCSGGSRPTSSASW